MNPKILVKPHAVLSPTEHLSMMMGMLIFGIQGYPVAVNHSASTHAVIPRGQSNLATLMQQLEDVWQHTDLLLASLSPEEQQEKHAKGWMTFGDLAYHLAYFDRELVAEPIQQGENRPVSSQALFKTGREVDAWNAQRFSERPQGQHFEADLALMRDSREAIRQAVQGLNDSQLDDPSYFFLPGFGWKTVRFALSASLMHTYSHMVRTRLRLRKNLPLPDDASIHTVLNTLFIELMPVLLNREEAQRAPFTAVMHIQGGGGGSWTFRVRQAAVVVTEGDAEEADLVMTHKNVDAFFRTTLGLQNPVVAMLTAKLRVRGFRHLPRFGKLFAAPKPDQVVHPQV